MAQTTLNVRIDEQLKNELEEFCNNVGMNISVAVNMFAKAVVREQRLPFEVAVDPFMLKKQGRKKFSDFAEPLFDTANIKFDREEANER